MSLRKLFNSEVESISYMKRPLDNVIGKHGDTIGVSHEAVLVKLKGSNELYTIESG